MSQVWLEGYKDISHFIKSSTKSKYHAFCNLCNAHFGVEKSGAYDVKTHCNGKKHTGLLKIRSQQKTFTGFGPITYNKKVIRAECYLALFIVEHNLSLKLADHLSPLMGKAFPDCETAKQIKCKRTKVRYIIKEMGKECTTQLTSVLKEDFFSISTDGSADKGGKKQLYPVLVRYYNPTVGKVLTEVLSIPAINKDSTGENIFELLDSEIKKYGLTWKQCLCLCSDNAAVMMGKYKGVASFVKKENPDCFINGCTCHLSAIAAKNAAKKLPVSVEDVLVDINCHMKGSSKRSRELREVQESVGLETSTILNYAATRWLSLGQCLSRLLENWTPLVLFFGNKRVKSAKRSADDEGGSAAKKVKSSHRSKSDSRQASAQEKASSSKHESSHRSKSDTNRGSDTGKASSSERHDKEKKKVASSQSSKPTKTTAQSRKSGKSRFQAQGREERIYQAMSDDRFKLYCIFLNANIKVFDEFNLFMQKDEPIIYMMQTKCIQLLTNLMVKFVKVSAFKACDNIIVNLNFKDKANQKSDEELAIGQAVKTFMSEVDLSEEDRSEFYKSVREYYVEACCYIKGKFPLDEEVLTNAEVADIGRRATASFKSVRYFLLKYPCVSKNVDHDSLELEFLRYQIDELAENVHKADRMDVKWGLLFDLYPTLARVMLAILCLPHSNADSERVFSATRRIQTEFRASMDMSLLSNLIVVKTHMLGRAESCYTKEFSDTFLARAKSATYIALHDAEEEQDVDDTLDDQSDEVLRVVSGIEKCHANSVIN